MKLVVEALGPGLKRPDRESDLSLTSSAEVKEESSCTPLPPYTFMAFTGTALFFFFTYFVRVMLRAENYHT